jgi:hypothetical protein
MRIRFRDVLSAEDREHVKRILNADVAAEGEGGPRKVDAFLRTNTYVDDGSVEAFKALSQRDRERVISDLIWRATCLVDGSVTNVQGATSFKLGRGFVAVQSDEDDRDVLCVVRVEE